MIKAMTKGVDHIGVTASFFCHDGKGNSVMALRGANARDEQGRWDIGGGGLEFGEKIEDRLRTEIKEEYCADVIEYEFLGFRDAHREHNGKPTHWISLDFKVRVDHAQVRNGEPHKFDDIRWCTLATLPQPLHSTIPLFFEKYRGKLI